MQHEKYTSQLQLSIKALEAKAKEKQQLQSSDKSKASVSNVKLQDRAERRAHSLTGKQLCPHTYSIIADISRKAAGFMITGAIQLFLLPERN